MASLWKRPTRCCANKLLQRQDCLSSGIPTSRLIRTLDGTLVVNVGSAGLPFDGDHRASYARLTWQHGAWHAEIVRLEYDRVQAERDFDETGFIAQAGPLARLMRAELQQARSTLYEWTSYYEAAVASGEMSLDESVKRVLAM